MTQSNNFTSKELIEYLTRLGKHINTIYGRLDAMDTQITIQANAMTKLQQSFDATKREAVLLLIDSLKQLPTIKVGDLPTLPPIPTDP
jgi:hypothetical protein